MASAEGEGVSLHAGIKETGFRSYGRRPARDRERVDKAAAPSRRPALLNQHRRHGRRPGLHPSIVTLKRTGLPSGSGPENEVQVARMEAVDDAAVLFVQERALIADRPVAGKRPLVQLRRARCINVAGVLGTTPPGETK